ncbi:PilT protein domain protein [Calothrix sp. NIES-4071]|nr:PilT protein domain protein [Calothrix sp. NIES-4071]BAZ54370.1 PilT protein domain protein [Calothrix sp. NIES-4105]
MNRPIQIVIDTNVLLSGLRSKRGASYKLLTVLEDERWQVNVSTTLVLEYEEILKREKDQLTLTFEEIDDFIDGICSLANLCDIFYLWRPTRTRPR